MIWKIISFNGVSLNSTDFDSYFEDRDNPEMQPKVTTNMIKRGAQNAPAAGGLVRDGDLLVATVLLIGPDKQAAHEALVTAVQVGDATLHALVAEDSSGLRWYVNARPVKHVRKANMNKIVFEVPDRIWRKVTAKTDSWAITASGQTKALTVGGTRDAYPVLVITPTSAKTGGFGYRKWIPLYNPLDVEQYDAVDLTGGGLNTSTLVGAGKMQADGDDLRIYDNGAEAFRWLADINAAATKVWVALRFQPRIEMALSGSIASSGAAAAITVKNTTSGKKAIERLPVSGTLLIGNEAFIYSGKDTKNFKIGTTRFERATHDTSMAAHADGDAVRWIEHDVWMYYGNSSMAAPETDDTLKPIFNLSTSTNASRVYTEMSEGRFLRLGCWKPAVLKSSGKLSAPYTSNHFAMDDPATELGLSMDTWSSAGRFQGETASLEWRFYHPAGITTVSMQGEKFLYSGTSWPTTALQKSLDGRNWSSQWTLPIPTLNTWVAWTKNSESLGAGYTTIRLLLSGSIPTSIIGYNNAALEAESCTLVLNSSNIIQFATTPGEIVNYELDCKITNNTTGEWMRLKFRMGLNVALTVDTNAGTISYADGTNAYNALTRPDGQDDWLRLAPGTNTLQFDDTGTNAVTIAFSYEERTP